MRVTALCGLAVLKHVDFGGGDAAAIDFLDSERCAEVESGHRLVKYLKRNSDIDERSEEHVPADAGEAVEIGHAHGRIVSRGKSWPPPTRRILLDKIQMGSKIRRGLPNHPELSAML